jgi:hypothetical protein
MSDSQNVASLQRTFTDPVVDAEARPSTSHEPRSHTRTTSKMSMNEVVISAGRPLVQAPRGRDTSRSSSRTRTPSLQYREREQRQAEQEEARAIRVKKRGRYSRLRETKPSNSYGSIAIHMLIRVRRKRTHIRVSPKRTARRGVGASSRRIRIYNGPIPSYASDIPCQAPLQGAGVAAYRATGLEAV